LSPNTKEKLVNIKDLSQAVTKNEEANAQMYMFALRITGVNERIEHFHIQEVH